MWHHTGLSGEAYSNEKNRVEHGLCYISYFIETCSPVVSSPVLNLVLVSGLGRADVGADHQYAVNWAELMHLDLKFLIFMTKGLG